MVERDEGGKVRAQPRDKRRSADPDVDVAALEPCYRTRGGKRKVRVSLL